MILSKLENLFKKFHLNINKNKKNANGDNYLRQRNGAKHGHDNPAFIDDTNLNKNARRRKLIFSK